MKLLRAITKVLTVPLLAVLRLLCLLINIAAKLSCFVLGPFMLFVFCCGVYTVVKQLWSQTFLLGLIEAICLAAIFGAGFIEVELESIGDRLGGFLRS